jgi:two-component system, chemotaxis family, sensor kinase Cph1
VAIARRNLAKEIQESMTDFKIGHLPTIRADETSMIQLFQNLISNALKYHSGDKPRIEIDAAKNGNEWLFSVQDNGIGIAPEKVKAIFEPFQRLHSKSDYPGTGIGLAICKRIVEQHRGKIWAESQPGKGSTFFFTIPIERRAKGRP